MELDGRKRKEVNTASPGAEWSQSRKLESQKFCARLSQRSLDLDLSIILYMAFAARKGFMVLTRRLAAVFYPLVQWRTRQSDRFLDSYIFDWLLFFYFYSAPLSVPYPTCSSTLISS